MPGLDLQWLLRFLLYFGVAVPTCIYALRQGGQPERLTAALVLLASAATVAIPQYPFVHVVTPLLVVDALLLGGLVAVALSADRYWPLYVAAVHLITVALHGVRSYDRDIIPGVYARLGGELGYLVLLILAFGTWRHERRAPEPDWTWQVRR